MNPFPLTDVGNIGCSSRKGPALTAKSYVACTPACRKDDAR